MQFLDSTILIKSDGARERVYFTQVCPEGIFLYPLDGEAIEERIEHAADERPALLRDNAIFEGGTSDRQIRALCLGTRCNGAPFAITGTYEIVEFDDPAFADIQDVFGVRIFRGRTALDPLELTLLLASKPWEFYLPMPHVVFGTQAHRKADVIKTYPRRPREGSDYPSMFVHLVPILGIARTMMAATRHQDEKDPGRSSATDIDQIVRNYLALTAREAGSMIRASRRLKMFALSALRRWSGWRALGRTIGTSTLRPDRVYDVFSRECDDLGIGVLHASIMTSLYLEGRAEKGAPMQSKTKTPHFANRIARVARVTTASGQATDGP